MTPLALVSYGPDSLDEGLLVDDGGRLVVLWPDGHADHVTREGDGYRHGDRVSLPIVSTDAVDMARALDYWLMVKW